MRITVTLFKKFYVLLGVIVPVAANETDDGRGHRYANETLNGQKNLLRSVFAYCVLIPALAILAAGVGDVASAQPVIYVDCARLDDTGDGLTPQTAFKTITAALSAATPNSIVHVAAGRYVGSVTISKPITLRGASNKTVIVNGTLTLGVSSCAAESLRIVGNLKNGVSASKVSNILLKEVVADSNGQAAQFTDVDGLTVLGGRYSHSTGEGLNTLRCRNMTLTNVIADSNTKSGINLVSAGGNSLITNCSVYGNKKHGLTIGDSSHHVRIVGGVFSDNGTVRQSDGGGIFIYSEKGRVWSITIEGPLTANGNRTAGVWCNAAAASYMIDTLSIAQTAQSVVFYNNYGAGVVLYGNVRNAIIGGTYTKGTGQFAAGVVISGTNSLGALSPQRIVLNRCTFNDCLAKTGFYTDSTGKQGNPAVSLNTGTGAGGYISSVGILLTGTTFVGATTQKQIESVIVDSLDFPSCGRIVHLNDNPPPDAVREEEAPRRFTLLQAWPNPFNPMTTIEFTLMSDAQASVRIFDHLGRQLETLFSGFAKGGVRHTLTFDGKRLASGVYYCRLDANGQFVTKKMILAK